MAFDSERLRSERVYRTTAPVSEVLADLVRLRSFDTEMEGQKEKWSQRALLCGILAGVAAVVGVLLIPAGYGAIVLGLAWVLVMAWFVCYRMTSRFRTLELVERRYELVLRLLKRLRRDIAPDAPVTVELDFRSTTEAENCKDRGSVGQWLAESFALSWLTLQTRLVDGTHLRLGVEERQQFRRRSLLNARGKYKTKRKQKSAMLLSVQLRVKPEKYPQLTRLTSKAKAAVQLPKAVRLTRLEVTDDRILMRTGMALDGDVKEAPRTFLMMLLSLYQVLNYSTSLRKQGLAKASP
ncbi:hypothetical protein JY651_42955 [Pyxidicoccus parkwayensis]|uniref:Uncharacterized protein n=1 Tax=Pyxidicoccus parkwayensis TaxID=2813578 RepID=A0ABX7NSG7_9BACT|nr:hypothetical protein [Pyxidicoccus parkwaysis]QSQ21840.1 hypothetical protein JY651_42955 [Pyxidicoccus parkwaysis]